MSTGKKVKGGLRFAAAALVSLIRAPISFALSAATVALSALGSVLGSIPNVIYGILGDGLIIKAIFSPLLAAGFVVRGVGCCLDFVNYRVCNEFLGPIAGESMPLDLTYRALSTLEPGTFFGKKFYYDRAKNMYKEGSWYEKGLVEAKTGEDYTPEALEDMLTVMFPSKRAKETDTEHEGRDSESELLSAEKDMEAVLNTLNKVFASEKLKSQRPGPEAQKSDDGKDGKGPGRQ